MEIKMLMLTTKTNRLMGVMPQAVVNIKGVHDKAPCATEINLDCGTTIYAKDSLKDLGVMWTKMKEQHDGKEAKKEEVPHETFTV